MDKITVPLSNGYSLIVEKNTGEFNKEVFVGIEDTTGRYIQDLAIIRPTYTFKNDNVVFGSDEFEVLVFKDSTRDDFTDKFNIDLYQEPNDEN